MATKNRLWGAERIRGELLKLGVRVSKRTIQRYMRSCRHKPRGQTWSAFIKNHAECIWSCDFVQSYDLLFRPVFLFFIVHLRSRRVVHVAATRNPSQGWTAQQIRNATMDGTTPRFLIRDRDDKFSGTFDDGRMNQVAARRYPGPCAKVEFRCRRAVAMVVMKPVALVAVLSLACASASPPKFEPPAARTIAPAHAQDDGVAGGVEGGTCAKNCDLSAAKLLPPSVGTGQRLADLSEPRYRPAVRPEYYRAGSAYWSLLKVFVSAAGQVTDVVVLKSTGVGEVDSDWRKTVESWPYRPYRIDGKPVPFCYPVRLEVRMPPKRKA